MVHLFKPGNKYAVGHGRPPKHPYVKAIESGDCSCVPEDILKIIARCDRRLLKFYGIPHKQINQPVKLIAAGYLHLSRGEKHE